MMHGNSMKNWKKNRIAWETLNPWNKKISWKFENLGQTKCRYFERNGIYYCKKHDFFVKIEQILWDIFNVKRLVQWLSNFFPLLPWDLLPRNIIPRMIIAKLSDYCASMQRFVWAQLVVTERVASERNRWTKRLWVGLNHAYLASIAGCCAAKYFCRQRAVGRHWNMTCGGRATGLRNLDISCANKWPRLQVLSKLVWNEKTRTGTLMKIVTDTKIIRNGGKRQLILTRTIDKDWIKCIKLN